MAIIKPNNNTLSAITALPAAISTGSLVKLHSSSISSDTASVSIDGHFTSDYDVYKFIVYDLTRRETFDEGIDYMLLRARARMNVMKYFYVEVGGDNLWNEPGFFIGIGFEYLDEDISKIVGLLGAGS